MRTIKSSKRQKCTKLIYHLSYKHQACPVQYFLLFHSLILFMKCTGRNFNVILLFKYSDTVIIIKCLKLLNYSLFHFLYLSVLKMQKIQFLWKNFSWSHEIWLDHNSWHWKWEVKGANYDGGLEKPWGYIWDTQKIHRDMDTNMPEKYLLDGIDPFILAWMLCIYAMTMDDNDDA